MIKWICTFLFYITLNAAIYQDEELVKLWSSVADINHPTLEDYQLIDRYLSTGARPYLNLIRESNQIEMYHQRMKSILNFKLVEPENKMPAYEEYAFNIKENSKRRCIVLYSSSNGIYPDKARKLLSEIENCGYSGHVLLRIGGFPNTQFGGLKICHVPYSFKVAFLKEAKLLGFKEILWIDLAIHPLSNFDYVFWQIELNGYFLTYVGSLQDNFSTHLPDAAKALHINTDLYPQIPHISTGMIGLNMEHEQARQLLDIWYRETEKVYPCMTWWPEELSLSVAAWRLECKPNLWFGDLVCLQSEQFQLEKRPKVQFYIDSLR